MGLHGAKIDFQFAAYLAKAVPGETWLERKTGIASGETRFPDEFRWRCVRDLLLALAMLERADLLHGDLSPNNVVIDLDAPPDEPALYLIDFDAFVAAAADANQAVTVAEGGTYGTEGYCPPDLAAAASAGDGSAAPYSDRYGRDMLLLEFLLMGSGLPADDPLVYWNREQLQRQFTAWRARTDPKCVQALGHLDPATVFTLDESGRPTSSGSRGGPRHVAPRASRAAPGHGAYSAHARGPRLSSHHCRARQGNPNVTRCGPTTWSAAQTVGNCH